MTEMVDYDSKKHLEQIVDAYLKSNPVEKKDNVNNEFEIRFGRNPRKPITKNDYENVVKQLHAVGFKTDAPNGVNSLRINSELPNKNVAGVSKTEIKMSSIRVELHGIDTIQYYCNTNDLERLMSRPNARDYKITFLQKSYPVLRERISDGDFLKPVDLREFGVRVSYQLEESFTSKNDRVKSIIKNWTTLRKTFRYINRVRFSHPTLPLFADISIVKSNKKSTVQERGKRGGGEAASDEKVDGGAIKKQRAPTENKVTIPTKTLQEAGVFDSVATYEVEFEIDNDRVGLHTPYNTALSLVQLIKRGIRIVLSGLQGTQFPISYPDQDNILQSYMRMLHGGEDGKDYTPRGVHSRDFIGPQPVTLQLYNVAPITENTNAPNIRKNYCVTEKADGDRRLLYVNDIGNIYMIDSAMNVIFTGTRTTKHFYNLLLDGEHIKYDKSGKYINTFAAFDLYYWKNKSVRELSFMHTADDIEKAKLEAQEKTNTKSESKSESESSKEDGAIPDIDLNQYRLYLLRSIIDNLKPQLITDIGVKKTNTITANTKACGFVIKCKTFYSELSISSEELVADKTIFDCCKKIMDNIHDKVYEYNTDGLIFTPCSLSVGASIFDAGGIAGKLQKSVWNAAFKWKPLESNTIDFLVSIKKNKKGEEEIHTIFEEGQDLTNERPLKQYKVIELRCGFDEKRHGYLNPADIVIQNKIRAITSKKNAAFSEDFDNEYKPALFMPTNPYDPTACYANIMLENDPANVGRHIMRSEEGEYFEGNTIVEFKYDPTREAGWRWIPLRVRYDKTSELQSGVRNYGNDYTVANNNWQTINNPISEQMITTGIGFINENDNENQNESSNTSAGSDVYYNKQNKTTTTQALRNFHNLYIKKKLIVGAASNGDTLIDYAVGKGGDLSKWISAKLKFVLGIDVSRDNIHNHLDGAYARYLNENAKYLKIPKALFLVGNSSNNIRNGDATTTDKEKNIINAVFGRGTKDKESLGEGVYLNYGIAAEGFNISSCQFAIHYFFEGEKTLHGFLQNLAECTTLGGYFIGTCFDGRSVFNLLKNKRYDESVIIMKNDDEDHVQHRAREKIFEVTKMYHETGFSDDETSIGYAINVFQESIGKTFREYLVNFEFLKRIMENYGFNLIETDTAKEMGLPSATGLFSELFSQLKMEEEMMKSKNVEYGVASNMSEQEKQISFLNRYFIFKKKRTVNAEEVYNASNKYKKSIDAINEEYTETHNAMEFSKKIIKANKSAEDKINDAIVSNKKEANNTKPKKTIVKKLKKKVIIIDDDDDNDDDDDDNHKTPAKK